MRINVLMIALLFWLAACSEPAPATPLPTPPTAVSDTDPTATAESTATPAPAEPTPTAVATAAPTAAAEAPESSAETLTITQPVTDTQFTVGSTLTMAGAAPPSTTAISLTLAIGPHTLYTNTVTLDAAGGWSAAYDVPPHVTGPARITASTKDETAVSTIEFTPLTEPDSPQITLARPFTGQLAAPGSPLFFEGSAENVSTMTLTIGFLVDECTESVARQSFALDDVNAEWNGYVILPEEIEAETGCAFVATGMPGDPNWREVIRPLPILQPEAEEEASIRLELGNATDATFTAGETVTLFGSAVNAPDDEITLIWYGTDEETILAETAVAVDALHFWEVDLTLPANAAGPSTLEIRAGEGDDATTLRTDFEIAP